MGSDCIFRRINYIGLRIRPELKCLTLRCQRNAYDRPFKNDDDGDDAIRCLHKTGEK